MTCNFIFINKTEEIIKFECWAFNSDPAYLFIGSYVLKKGMEQTVLTYGLIYWRLWLNFENDEILFSTWRKENSNDMEKIILIE